MLLILLICSRMAILFAEEYPYELYLDLEKRLHLAWKVDYSGGGVDFELTVLLHPDEWCGVGFSDYGEIYDADLVVTWTDRFNIHHFQDTWTDDKGFLHVDDRQDYHLNGVKTEKLATIMEFHRNIDTCDDFDYLLDNGTTHIIFFIAKGHPNNIEGFNMSRAQVGLQRVQVLKPDITHPKFPNDIWTFAILAPHVKVPAKETTYWWYVTKMPVIPNKQHIIQYEGVIQKGNEMLVHHMEVFHCEVASSVTVTAFSGPGHSEGKPPELSACRNVIGAWAMGAKELVLPAEAGLPIGGAGYSLYVLLEIHYNNPEVRSDWVDHSGIRFTVTPTLRHYDAGVMEIGLEYTNKMAIPPLQKLFPLTGYCTARCTNEVLPHHGIHIFASQLHTHLTGKQVYVKHVRDGVELPELNRDNHYSPHFQEIRALPQPVHIMARDALIVTCQDSTINRRKPTIGGFAITDEMCVSYVFYYPLTDLEVCKSSIQTKVLDQFFEFMNWWNGDYTSPDKGDRANYNSIRWTPQSVHMLKSLYDTAPLSVQCNRSSGQRFLGQWEGIPVTKITEPLPAPERSCESIRHPTTKPL